MTYTFTGNYTEFNAEVTKLIEKNNAGEFASRSDKIAEVKRLIDAYITQTGKSPESNEVERLTDAILSEELKSMDTWKARNEEYPFFSERQLERRQNGEAPIKAVHYYGSDERDYRVPTKRNRTWYENSYVDKTAKIRNDERRRQYRVDTSPGPVVTYMMPTEEIMVYLTEKYGRKLA